jgi:ATP-dependent DNA helicase RecQ
LSCVVRTGQRFGAAHLTDVLVGAKTDRIRQFGHDQLPTYGIGKEFSRDQWRSIFRQLVTHGLLTTDMEGHGGLRLSSDELCRPVLRGETKVHLREDLAAKVKRDLKATSKDRPVLDNDDDEQLFQTLRALRLHLAKAQNVPPYVIFHDTTLMALAKQRPENLAAMRTIPGIGAAKLERYGEEFLMAIHASSVMDKAG